MLYLNSSRNAARLPRPGGDCCESPRHSIRLGTHLDRFDRIGRFVCLMRLLVRGLCGCDPVLEGSAGSLDSRATYGGRITAASMPDD